MTTRLIIIIQRHRQRGFFLGSTRSDHLSYILYLIFDAVYPISNHISRAYCGLAVTDGVNFCLISISQAKKRHKEAAVCGRRYTVRSREVEVQIGEVEENEKMIRRE